MRYQTINKENAIKLADSNDASYGSTFKLSQKVKSGSEVTGEGNDLDLSLLEKFIKPMQEEWERLKTREDYPTWDETKRNIHVLDKK